MSVERLTGRKEDGHAYVIGCPEFEVPKEANTVLQPVVDKCADLEDVLGDTYDIDRLRELVEADKDGRIKIIPGYIDKACGTCAHFLRIEGTCRGKCAVKPLACSRYTTWNSPFEPSQSRKACKQYIAAETALAKEADHE